jgi:hypothetical protein
MLRSSFVLLALLPLASGCRQPLEDFASSDLKFKARFPGTPARETKPGPFGMKLATYSLRTGDGTFSVGVAEMPNEDGDTDAVKDDRLEGALQAAVRSYNGTLRSRATRQLDGKYPGREFIAVCGNTKAPVIRGRLYIINRRLYQIVTTGSEKSVMSGEGLEFLDSFEWTP